MSAAAAGDKGAPRVVLVDDHGPFRSGVRAELGRQVDVAVRDRGSGFDIYSVPADRKGVAESIRGRMLRHGGKAVVQSTLGEGTKVTLTMARGLAPAGPAPADGRRR